MWRIGDVIEGRYDVADLLGAGGMGLPDPGTASGYEDSLQRVGDDIFPVTPAAADCTPARGRVIAGTHKEFEFVGRRLERDLSAVSGFKIPGIAIVPPAGFTPGGAPLGFTRNRTRLGKV
jgi:hypothetical protein